MTKTKQTESKELSVLSIKTGRITFCIRGSTPLIFNAMSEKAKHELLLPRGRKTTADRAENLKHVPIEEFRNSVYARRDSDLGPTRLVFPGAAFKRSMASAALRLPGVKKTEVGQLVWVRETSVDIYGIPQIYSAIVRSSDMNRTPDVRTRAIVTDWATRLAVQYVEPLIREQTVINLLAAAGVMMGVGDGRQEKGSLSFGQFDVVSPDDEKFNALVKNCGREAQDAALAAPSYYDLETERLLQWFDVEIVKMTGRGVKHVREVA